ARAHAAASKVVPLLAGGGVIEAAAVGILERCPIEQHTGHSALRLGLRRFSPRESNQRASPARASARSVGQSCLPRQSKATDVPTYVLDSSRFRYSASSLQSAKVRRIKTDTKSK